MFPSMPSTIAPSKHVLPAYGLEAAGVDELEEPLPEPWNRRRAATWERIFDVDELVVRAGWESWVQATFERLDLADVVEVTEFLVAPGRVKQR